MKRVYCDMCGDLFHYGHINFLRKCRQFGDILIVGVHSDETIKSYKRVPILTMFERISVIESCRYVDEIVPESPLQITDDFIKKHSIDYIVTVNNKTCEELDTMYSEIKNKTIIKCVEYTANISTTEIIKRIKSS